MSQVQTPKRLDSFSGEVVGFGLKKFLTNSRELQKRINNAEGIEHVESDAPQLSYSDETLCQGNAWDYANQGIWQAQNNSRSTMEHQAVTSTLQCLRVGPTCQEVSTYQKESCQSLINGKFYNLFGP